MAAGVLARNELWEVATVQHGFVTAAQASDLGVGKHALQMLVQRGTLMRAAFGVYRFPQFPVSQYDPYMLAPRLVTPGQGLAMAPVDVRGRPPHERPSAGTNVQSAQSIGSIERLWTRSSPPRSGRSLFAAVCRSVGSSVID